MSLGRHILVGPKQQTSSSLLDQKTSVVVGSENVFLRFSSRQLVLAELLLPNVIHSWGDIGARLGVVTLHTMRGGTKNSPESTHTFKFIAILGEGGSRGDCYKGSSCRGKKVLFILAENCSVWNDNSPGIQ